MAVNSEAAHDAWTSSVAAQAAARGAPLVETPPEDAAWFQSGHSRRTEGMKAPLPPSASRADAGGEEGVVKAQPLAPWPPPEPAPAPGFGPPRAAKTPAGTDFTAHTAQPVQAASQEAAVAAAPAAPSRPAGPVPPLPEMAESVFGGALWDWLGPLAAVLVGVVSIHLFGIGNDKAPRTLPPQRYFSPVPRVAALAAKLFAEVEREHPPALAAAPRSRAACRPACPVAARPRGGGTCRYSCVCLVSDPPSSRTFSQTPPSALRTPLRSS